MDAQQGTTNTLPTRIIGDLDFISHLIRRVVTLLITMGCDTYSMSLDGYDITFTKRDEQ